MRTSNTANAQSCSSSRATGGSPLTLRRTRPKCRPVRRGLRGCSRMLKLSDNGGSWRLGAPTSPNVAVRVHQGSDVGLPRSLSSRHSWDPFYVTPTSPCRRANSACTAQTRRDRRGRDRPRTCRLLLGDRHLGSRSRPATDSGRATNKGLGKQAPGYEHDHRREPADARSAPQAAPTSTTSPNQTMATNPYPLTTAPPCGRPRDRPSAPRRRGATGFGTSARRGAGVEGKAEWAPLGVPTDRPPRPGMDNASA